MRLVVDVNVILSALIAPASSPGHVLQTWRQGKFDLLTCEEHLEELRRATRYPKIRERVVPSVAGKLINEIAALGIYATDLPRLELSPDPWDDYLLALAQAGQAEFLVTGDKAGLLALGSFGRTRIATARQFLDLA